MISNWKYKDPSKKFEIEIFSAIFGGVLFTAGKPLVNEIAQQGAEIARSYVGPSDQRFITHVPAQLFFIKSKQIRSSLSRHISIPVALIVNNSHFALKREISSSKGTPPRPMFNAWNQLRTKKGIRGVRGKDDVTVKGLGG